MNTVLLCIAGSTEIIPAVKNSSVVKGDYVYIQSVLEEDIHNGKQVIILGSGDKAYSAASLATRYEKKCFINGQWFEFRKNASEKLSYLESLMLLTSQCTEERLFKEVAAKLTQAVLKQTPSKISFEQANEILSKSAPAITLVNGKSASEYLLNSFALKLEERKLKNKKRITVTADNKKIIEKEMNYSDVAKFIFENPGHAYALTADKGEGKTEVINALFEMYTASATKALLMTSTVTLTNALCCDERNYKNALANNSISKLTAIAACLYSAMLTPAFKEFRENAKVAIFEEYESCRDALLADIVGKTGSLEEKTTAQMAFNESLKTETVILTDAHLSQQSADHFTRTTGRKLFVIKPIIEHKKPAKKLIYYANRNVAIQNIRNTIDGKGRALTMSDCKHSGGKSKFRAMDIEINKGFDIKNIAVDAAFFAEPENMKHMQNPTEFVNQYDHVLCTPVWRNGISMFSNFDLLTMICHQTVAPLDVLQWSERDRLNLLKALFINDVPSAPQVSWIGIFENELKKGILSVEVDSKRKLLKRNQATKDIIDRIEHNNNMRLDYANNVLSMFELQGYEIEYNYQASSKALNQREYNAAQEEKSERLSIYKTLDAISKMDELRDIKDKEDELRHIDEKRLSYANDVFNYYNIDTEAEEDLFDSVFKFDADGYGRTKIENYFMTNFSQPSKYYIQHGKEIIFKKLFECLGLDRQLQGEFSKQNYDEFFSFISNEEISFGKHSERAITVFRALFPHIKITGSTWVVKGLLSKEFGLNVKEVTRKHENESGGITESKPTIRNKNNGKIEYLMNITRDSAEPLLSFFKLAYPMYKEAVEGNAETTQESTEYTNIIEHDFENQSYDDFYNRVLDEAI